MQAMVSTPFAFRLSAFWRKPGRCFASQVGVNAPGTENSTTFLPLNRSSVEMSRGPFGGHRLRACLEGMRSPALMVMRIVP